MQQIQCRRVQLKMQRLPTAHVQLQLQASHGGRKRRTRTKLTPKPPHISSKARQCEWIEQSGARSCALTVEVVGFSDLPLPPHNSVHGEKVWQGSCTC
jgi:hypothetical protein